MGSPLSLKSIHWIHIIVNTSTSSFPLSRKRRCESSLQGDQRDRSSSFERLPRVSSRSLSFSICMSESTLLFWWRLFPFRPFWRLRCLLLDRHQREDNALERPSSFSRRLERPTDAVLRNPPRMTAWWLGDISITPFCLLSTNASVCSILGPRCTLFSSIQWESR